jgi:anaerobic selenocysteine-containing dehydrogenase
MDKDSSSETHYHACNLCEAICGLVIEVNDGKVASIRGDKNDPLSKGHICPKAVALQDIYEDTDRLRRPVRKTPDGWKQISWDEAFTEVANRLNVIRRESGNDAVAVYLGNPTVHNLEAMLFGPMFLRALRTRNRFSATSVDQLPEQLVSRLMFGHSLLIPLPDLDRTDFVLIFGANPAVSNGSLMTAPGVKKRLKGIQERGGQVVVIDPRKSETAKIADRHHFIRPGSDAALLLALLNVVFSENLGFAGKTGEYTKGLAAVKTMAEGYTPEKVSGFTGIEADAIRALARDFCAAKTAVCYGRIGVSTQQFGTLSQWLIVVLNVVTGNLDSVGGAMFSKPAFDVLKPPSKRQSRGFNDSQSRVRGLPDFEGEFPVATLADEINTPGKGQVRALVTNSGNPVLSTPNGEKLDNALGKLDFMVSIDFYINETTRHADIILPPLSALERPHYDVVFHVLAIQNTARYSPPVFKPASHARSDTEIFLELARRLGPQGFKQRIAGRAKKEFLVRAGAEWVINRELRKGPYDIDLKTLKQNPHGVDLGPLAPCLPERLFTRDKMIDLAPPEFMEDIGRLDASITEFDVKVTTEFDLLLIGRREIRTNNSWLHNSHRMVKGKERCIAFVNPVDAEARHISDGDLVSVKSKVGLIELPVSLSDDMMPGVISIPHGWGHVMEDIRLSVAAEHPGVNVNLLTDENFLDVLSGNAALNGVPVSLTGSN